MSAVTFQKIALGIAGVTASAIGCLILAAPHTFYASYGIDIGTDPDLLSELRAPGANLLALGAIMLAGIPRPALAPVSRIIAVTVFFAFPAGRILGFVVDGAPSNGIVGALAIELAIGALCVAAFWNRPARSISANAAPTG